jgi:molecular chaperone GrpE
MEEEIKNERKMDTNEEAEVTQESQETPEKVPKEYKKTIKKLETALAAAQEERDTFKDNYQRTFSEFNNFKKRNQSAVSQAITTGMCDAVEKILPVLDNLERALGHVDEENDDPMAKGVTMVLTQLKDILAGMGVKEIPAKGEPFDPCVHQAIQQTEPKDGEASGTIADVVQKGYMLGDKILRHSMVIVNK